MLLSHWPRARGQATLGTLWRAVIGQEPGDNLSLVESQPAVTPAVTPSPGIRDGPQSLLSEYLSGQLFTQAPSAESDHHSFVVTPSPRNRRRRGHIMETGARSELGAAFVILLTPELAGHSRLSLRLSLC